VVADHVGTFVDWTGPIETHVEGYAKAVRRHLSEVADPDRFISAFLSGFTERFLHIQGEYAKHRRAFDTLFNHRPWDPAGSMACRWYHVLERLRRAEARKIGQLLSGRIRGV
jgi:hypothetical protein